MSAITNNLAQPFNLSPATAAQQSKLGADISAFNRGAAELETQAAALRNNAVGDWSLTDDTVAAQLRCRKIELLNSEISLRLRIASYFATVMANDYPAAVNVAVQAVDDAERSIHANLVGIGFVPSNETNPGLARLLNLHPDVSEAKTTCDALRSFDLREQRDANSEALQACREALAKVKIATMAILR